MTTYRIGYEAGDGTFRNFRMESEYALPRSTSAGFVHYGTPLLMAIKDEIRRRETTSEPMIAHGGYKYLRYVRNEATSQCAYFNQFC